jgi:hypothetical protein
LRSDSRRRVFLSVAVRSVAGTQGEDDDSTIVDNYEEQEALLRSFSEYARLLHGMSAAPEATFPTAAAATPPRADGKRGTLTGDDHDEHASDAAGHAALLGHAMFAILRTVSPDCRSTAKDGAATWYDILQCSEDLRELPLGSEEFLERLRKGCADAEKGVQLGGKARCNVFALKLHLLGWETDGGATLPLEAKPLIDELGAVLKWDAEFVGVSVARFWVAVAYRFCDARHLNNIRVDSLVGAVCTHQGGAGGAQLGGGVRPRGSSPAGCADSPQKPSRARAAGVCCRVRQSADSAGKCGVGRW